MAAAATSNLWVDDSAFCYFIFDFTKVSAILVAHYVSQTHPHLIHAIIHTICLALLFIFIFLFPPLPSFFATPAFSILPFHVPIKTLKATFFTLHLPHFTFLREPFGTHSIIYAFYDPLILQNRHMYHICVFCFRIYYNVLCYQ